MSRFSRSLLWVLLVPYFAVASLIVQPWIGESRESFNRTNAQLTAAIILASFEIALLALAGLSRGEVWDKHLALICWALLLLPWLAIARWLNKAKESDYRKLYRGMSVKARLAFGIIAAAFVFGCWWLVGHA